MNSNKVTYNSSFKNKNSHLITTYIYIGTPIISSLLIYDITEWEDILESIFILGQVVLIFVVPSLLLHYQYNKYSLGISIDIDYSNEEIHYLSRTQSHKFKFVDIEIFEKFYSLALVGNRIGWVPWDSYNYVKISLKNGSKFIITSFLVSSFELPIESSKKKLHKMFFPFITFY